MVCLCDGSVKTFPSSAGSRCTTSFLWESCLLFLSPLAPLLYFSPVFLPIMFFYCSGLLASAVNQPCCPELRAPTLQMLDETNRRATGASADEALRVPQCCFLSHLNACVHIHYFPVPYQMMCNVPIHPGHHPGYHPGCNARPYSSQRDISLTENLRVKRRTFRTAQ